MTQEEIVNYFIQTMQAHAEPRNYDWAMYFVAIGGVVVSFVAILFTAWIYSRQTKVLLKQTEIAGQQNRITLLDKHYLIYDTYMKSRQILNFHTLEIYASLGLLNAISLQIDKIITMQDEIFSQYNKAKFLYNDDKILLGNLKEIAHKYIEVSNFYIEVQPRYIEISKKAWEAVHEKFPDINDLPSIMQNKEAKKIFETHCTTPDSKHLDALINQYEKRFADENFDIHFKKYLTIK